MVWYGMHGMTWHGDVGEVVVVEVVISRIDYVRDETTRISGRFIAFLTPLETNNNDNTSTEVTTYRR